MRNLLLLLIITPLMVFGFGNLTTEKIDVIENNTGSQLQIKPDIIGDNDVVIADRLQVNSTTEASRPCPEMTNTERDALTPATGDCIYSSTDSAYYYYNGSVWGEMGGGTDATVNNGLVKYDTTTGKTKDTQLIEDADGLLRTTATDYELLTLTDDSFANKKFLDLNFQPLDADLTALSSLSSTGFVSRTGASTYTERSLTGTANEIEITNPTGAAGDPIIGIVDNPVFGGNESVTVPSGTAAQRPGSPTAGMIRFNSDDNVFEGYTDDWGSLGGGLGSAQTVTIIEADTNSSVSDFDGNNVDFYGDAGASSANGLLQLSTTASNFLTGVKKVFQFSEGLSSQNDYWGYNVALPQGWAGRTLAYEFTYRTDDNYTDGSVTFHALCNNGSNDTDMSAGGYPLDKFYSADGNGETFRILFNAPADCETIRLGFQNQSATLTKSFFYDKLSIDIDDFNYKQIPNITDWQKYSPTYTGFGTVSNDEMYYRVLGDTLQIRGSVTPATVSSTTAKMTLPDGYTIDTSKIVNNRIISAGVWFRGGLSTTNTGGSVNIISTTTDGVFFSAGLVFSGSSTQVNIQADSNGMMSNGNELMIPIITLPIKEGTAYTKHVVVDSGEADTEFYRIDTHGGLSSTNTRVPYFVNTRDNETGDLISVSNSATTGFRITALQDVEIIASYQCMFSGTGGGFGITKNSTELSTGIDSISDRSKVVARANTISSNTSSNAVFTGVLKAGDYIVPHVNATTFNASVASQTFTVSATKATKGEYHLVPVSDQENVFSAKIGAGGSFSDENSPFIESVTNDSTGFYTVTWKSGIFTQRPNVTAIVRAAGGDRTVSVFSDNATQARFDVSAASNNVNVNHEFYIFVQKTGADYQEPKVMISNPNLDLYVKTPDTRKAVVCSWEHNGSNSTINKQYGGCLASCPRTGTGNYSCTWTSGYWAEYPVCQFSYLGDAINGRGFPSPSSSFDTESAWTFQTRNASDSLADRNWTATCHGIAN